MKAGLARVRAASSNPLGHPVREHRIALFGGTFDPIHAGHWAVARAAQRRFRLNSIHFIPNSRPPHKGRRALASFADRYAMVALACAGRQDFVASLAESGGGPTDRDVFYSVDSVRRFKNKFRATNAHFYFLLGADSFLRISTWKNYKALLGLCDFIVASRPGFDIGALRLAIPPQMLASGGAKNNSRVIALRRTSVYVLDTVSSAVSATRVRARLERKQSIHGLVPAYVEEYITKQALYR